MENEIYEYDCNLISTEIDVQRSKPVIIDTIKVISSSSSSSSSSSLPSSLSSSPSKKRKIKKEEENLNPIFCLCGYGDGEMIGCDGIKCIGNNWYHLECLNMSPQNRNSPRSIWYCPDCTIKLNKKSNNKRNTKKDINDTSSIQIDESKFIVSKLKSKAQIITPNTFLKVSSAERQSREAMVCLYYFYYFFNFFLY
jgi:hypothetical protein